MSKKEKCKDGIFFTGEASCDVTGSQYYVKFGEYKCLLECGLYQSSKNSYLDSYKINSRKFSFKPSEIDYVFVCHPHIDHCGLLPRLVREGFHGEIIATKNTAAIMKPLLKNSCYIVNDEARLLSKIYKREYKPIYSISDLYDTLDLIRVYDEYDVIYKLNDTISFQWLKNSHCLGAAQLQLILTGENKSKKVLYTSDIGDLHSMNHYVGETEVPKMFNDVVIMESTYGNTRSTKKTRKQELEHLEAAIVGALDRGGSAVFPCFSFSRTQEMLTVLYSIFGEDKDFKTPVIVDSKLSCEICDLYKDLLVDEDLEYWDKVRSWENVKFVSGKNESEMYLMDDYPKIVISSSGFCTNGRIINYLRKYLRDRNSIIIFSGYTGDNPSYLSYRIKKYRDNKYISINKVKVPNNADCLSLATFSNHANFDNLIEYGSWLNTNKLILVHGTKESKAHLMAYLKHAISEHDRTYPVQISSKNMVYQL